VPPNVEAALACALEKLPADRFESVADFAAALDDERFTYQARARTAPAQALPEGPIARPGAPWHRDRRVVSALGFAAVASLFAVWGWLRPTSQPEPGVTTRTEVTGLDGATDLAISPDGRWIVTRQGTTIGFIDDEKASVFIGTPGANKILLSDDEETVQLSDQHGNAITLNADGVTIKSAKDVIIDASGNVEIKGAKVDVK